MRKFLDNETWDFSTTWPEPRSKLNQFHADFLFTSITFCSCIWSKITEVSHKMTSNILQHLQITNLTYPLRTATAETSYKKWFVFTSGIPIPSRSAYIYMYIYKYIYIYTYIIYIIYMLNIYIIYKIYIYKHIYIYIYIYIYCYIHFLLYFYFYR